jgi:hypothetical protein
MATLNVTGTVLLLNQSMTIGGTANYLKLGTYRGWAGQVPQTTAARYSNIRVA